MIKNEQVTAKKEGKSGRFKCFYVEAAAMGA